MKVYIGTSGWNYKHWDKRFYPKEIKKQDWLNYYSQKFNTVEVNNTFYKWPEKEILKKWRKQTPSNFEFSIKAPRTITHLKKLKNVKKYLEDLYEVTNELKKKKAVFLFQLPPSYKFNDYNFKKLKIFIQELDKRKNNVIEFRDKKWWNPKVLNYFKEQKVMFCSVSGLKMPDDIINIEGMIYLRLHGKNYSSNYTDSQVKKIAEKIKSKNPEEVYIYFNNDLNAYAPKNALKLKEEIENE